MPNPKTSGNGRYTYLAAWGSVIAKGGNEAQARDFVAKLLANVPVLDGGGRGATTTFTQRDIGDVLVTFENEAELIENEFGKGRYEVVYPSITIEAEAPVAINEKVTARRGSADAAKAYLDFLYSPAGQEIIARHNFRPPRQGGGQAPCRTLRQCEDLHRGLAAGRLARRGEDPFRRRRHLRPAGRQALSKRQASP